MLYSYQSESDRYGLVHDGYKNLGPVDIFCFWENVFLAELMEGGQARNPEPIRADKLTQTTKLQTDMHLSMRSSGTRHVVPDHVKLGRTPSDQTGSYYSLTKENLPRTLLRPSYLLWHPSKANTSDIHSFA